MDYMLRLPKKIYCGDQAVGQLVGIAQGQKVVVFTDRGVCQSVAFELPLAALRKAGAEVLIFDDLPAEPTCDQAQAVVDRFRQTGAGLIVAVGGGSVMDVAKLASIASFGQYDVRDLLTRPELGQKTVPTVMIPTTAGTGSEATANSIVAIPEKEVKFGIVNEQMIADYVLLDGAMTATLPAHIAASTGIDALCHAIECYTSGKANPFSDLFALEAIRLIFANLERAVGDPAASGEKTAMLLAAFYGGAAIASSGTTAVHALSYPLGGKYHIAHGVANAMLLLPVLRFNRDWCERELSLVYDAMNPSEPIDPIKKPTCVLAAVQSLLERLGLPPRLSAYGIGAGDLDVLVAAGMQQQRLLVNNKRPVTEAAARAIYQEIL